MRHAIHIIISAVAILLAVAHLIWPDVRIDAITLALVVIAILPWLGSVFRSVELPGGMKVQYQELEKAQEQIEEAGLLATPEVRKEDPAYMRIAEHDPNLALAGLRIEIEKKLRAIAKAHGLSGERWSVGITARQLSEKGVLTKQEYSALIDLIAILNNAVHGAEVDQRAVEWAFEIRPHLLASLDKRANESS